VSELIENDQWGVCW